MASFQVVVLVIAIILLILALTFVGISLKNSGSGSDTTWPPVISACPDYWTIDYSGNDQLCLNTLNLVTPCSTANFNKAGEVYTNCDKKTWATNCGVSWDGITYGVPDPCDVSSSTTT
jgi:hypothetical protein